jgi:hypothetical protein
MRSRLFPARNATGSMRYRGPHLPREDRREAIVPRALEGGVLEGSRRIGGSGAGPSDHPLGAGWAQRSKVSGQPIGQGSSHLKCE